MNVLNGHILAIACDASIALIDVEVAGLRLCATILGEAQTLALWRTEQPVQLQFNEMEVAVAKNMSGQISLRNRLPGTITALEWGRILTRVYFRLNVVDAPTILRAVITTRSAQHLQLAVGDAIEALVKSNETHLFALPETGELGGAR